MEKFGFDIEDYVVGTGCLDIQYQEKMNVKCLGKKINGKMEWKYENNQPMKCVFKIKGEKISSLKKDMEDIKVYDKEGVFYKRIKNGYENFYSTFLKVLELFGYSEEDLEFKDKSRALRDRQKWYREKVYLYIGDDELVVNKYDDYNRYEIGGGIL